jgi:hypothetical protein
MKKKKKNIKVNQKWNESHIGSNSIQSSVDDQTSQIDPEMNKSSRTLALSP